MKCYTLDETWVLCLRMWRWIARERKKSRRSVETLKYEWLKKNGFKEDSIRDDCFFCGYANQPIRDGCSYCPGRKVDSDFDCCGFPAYGEDPIGFYKKLLALNRKRLKKKAKPK